MIIGREAIVVVWMRKQGQKIRKMLQNPNLGLSPNITVHPITGQPTTHPHVKLNINFLGLFSCGATQYVIPFVCLCVPHFSISYCLISLHQIGLNICMGQMK